MSEENKGPWYNDGDRVSGLAATIVLLGIAALAVAGIIKFIIWMF